ncbi:unnamed protein product [Brassica oleracea]
MKFDPIGLGLLVTVIGLLREMDEDDELGGWDKDFLDAAFKAKEILLSTQVPPPAPPIVPPPAPASDSVELHSTGQQRHKTPVRDPFANFSSQRVLSQTAGGFRADQEARTYEMPKF